MSQYNNTSTDPVTPGVALKWILLVFGVLAVVIAISVGGCAGLKSFSRSQARADAHNKVSITAIEIQNQDQQAKVVAAQNGIVAAQAHQRYLQSVGVREAQDEIAKTLTPLYIQYEAIQAEMAIAKSGQNNTVVYVPSGNAGVPLITANASTGK